MHVKPEYALETIRSMYTFLEINAMLPFENTVHDQALASQLPPSSSVKTNMAREGNFKANNVNEMSSIQSGEELSTLTSKTV